MDKQRGKKVARKNERKIRPLYALLIAIVISMNLFVGIDIILINQTTKHVNEEIAELNKKQSEEIQRSIELNNQLTEILNRLHQDEPDRE